MTKKQAQSQAQSEVQAPTSLSTVAELLGHFMAQGHTGEIKRKDLPQIITLQGNKRRHGLWIDRTSLELSGWYEMPTKFDVEFGGEEGLLIETESRIGIQILYRSMSLIEVNSPCADPDRDYLIEIDGQPFFQYKAVPQGSPRKTLLICPRFEQRGDVRVGDEVIVQLKAQGIKYQNRGFSIVRLFSPDGNALHQYPFVYSLHTRALMNLEQAWKTHFNQIRSLGKSASMNGGTLAVPSDELAAAFPMLVTLDSVLIEATGSSSKASYVLDFKYDGPLPLAQNVIADCLGSLEEFREQTCKPMLKTFISSCQAKGFHEAPDALVSHILEGSSNEVESLSLEGDHGFVEVQAQEVGDNADLPPLVKVSPVYTPEPSSDHIPF